MSEERKIISFNKEKEKLEQQKELKSCIYRGSMTIDISGDSLEDAITEIYVEYFTDEEIYKYLKGIFRDLLSKNTSTNMFQINLNNKLILNTCTEIFFYEPIDKRINKFFYQYYADDEQLLQIIAYILSYHYN